MLPVFAFGVYVVGIASVRRRSPERTSVFTAGGLPTEPDAFPPDFAQRTSVDRCCAVSFLVSSPTYSGDAEPGGHGGMTLASTAAPIACAHFEACFAVWSENGAMPPTW